MISTVWQWARSAIPGNEEEPAALTYAKLAELRLKPSQPITVVDSAASGSGLEPLSLEMRRSLPLLPAPSLWSSVRSSPSPEQYCTLEESHGDRAQTSSP